MKQSYIKPALATIVVNVQHLICESPGITTTETQASSSNAVLVKERHNYNVWDDDWSN